MESWEGNARGHKRFRGDNLGQTILNSLKSPDVLVGKTIEKRVSLVQPAPYEGCCHGLNTIQANMFPDAAQVSLVFHDWPVLYSIIAGTELARRHHFISEHTVKHMLQASSYLMHQRVALEWTTGP